MWNEYISSCYKLISINYLNFVGTNFNTIFRRFDVDFYIFNHLLSFIILHTSFIWKNSPLLPYVFKKSIIFHPNIQFQLTKFLLIPNYFHLQLDQRIFIINEYSLLFSLPSLNFTCSLYLYMLLQSHPEHRLQSSIILLTNIYHSR